MNSLENIGKTTVECGYCLEEGEQLTDPRLLPCNHTHCYPCLVGNFEINRIVRCGKCKEVSDVTLARLPSAARREDNTPICSVCSERGTSKKLAVSYCTTCSRKMCLEHMELHQEFQPLHKDILSIEEYKRCREKLETRNCDKHQERPVIMGCSTCHQGLCASCLDGTEKCSDGLDHRIVALEGLVKRLKSKKDEVKVEAEAKEEKLSELLKSSTRILSEFERRTEELLELLHNTRDEQLTELQRKYDELEGELIEERRRSKEQLVDFMEREIGVRLTEMNTLLVLQDVRFRDAHQVDIMSNFAQTTREIRRLIDENLPSMTLANQRKLSIQGKQRNIELKLASEANIHVRQLPSMTLCTLKTQVDAARHNFNERERNPSSRSSCHKQQSIFPLHRKKSPSSYSSNGSSRTSISAEFRIRPASYSKISASFGGSKKTKESSPHQNQMGRRLMGCRSPSPCRRTNSNLSKQITKAVPRRRSRSRSDLRPAHRSPPFTSTEESTSTKQSTKMATQSIPKKHARESLVSKQFDASSLVSRTSRGMGKKEKRERSMSESPPEYKKIRPDCYSSSSSSSLSFSGSSSSSESSSSSSDH